MKNKTNTARPKYFQCYLDNETLIQHLSDEQAGRLLKYILEYANTGNKPCIEENVLALAFDVMAQQIDRDFEKYRAKCEKNRAKINKRWQTDKNNDEENQSGEYQDIPECTNVYQRIPQYTGVYQSIPENTTVYQLYQDKEKDKDKNKNKNEYEEKDEEKKKDENKNEDKNEDEITSGAAAVSADASSACADTRNALKYHTVMNSFNWVCKSLPRVERLNSRRKQRIERAAAVLGELPFEEYFKRIEASDFLSGRNGKWQGCCFDWALKADNILKVLEGNYDNKPQIPLKESVAQAAGRKPSYDIAEIESFDEFK